MTPRVSDEEIGLALGALSPGLIKDLYLDLRDLRAAATKVISDADPDEFTSGSLMLVKRNLIEKLAGLAGDGECR